MRKGYPTPRNSRIYGFRWISQFLNQPVDVFQLFLCSCAASAAYYSDSVRLSATPARGCHVAPFLGSKRGVPVEVRVTDGGIGGCLAVTAQSTPLEQLAREGWTSLCRALPRTAAQAIVSQMTRAMSSRAFAFFYHLLLHYLSCRCCFCPIYEASLAKSIKDQIR